MRNLRQKVVKSQSQNFGRCPKCRGYLQVGGVRFGMPAPEIWGCLKCGLSSESSGYLDAIKNQWVEIGGKE